MTHHLHSSDNRTTCGIFLFLLLGWERVRTNWAMVTCDHCQSRKSGA